MMIALDHDSQAPPLDSGLGYHLPHPNRAHGKRPVLDDGPFLSTGGASPLAPCPAALAARRPYGAGNGLLLPYVMDYNVPACPGRLAAVARLLGEEVGGLSAPAAAGRAVEAVQALKRDTGIPLHLRDVGVKESDLRPLAEATTQITRLLRANPRPLDVDALEGILRRAW
jgi:hypothetical protein